MPENIPRFGTPDGGLTWVSAGGAEVEVVPEPVRYELPGEPPVGTKLIDGSGITWRRRVDGQWALIAIGGPDAMAYIGEPCTWRWVELLADFGPLTVVPPTEQERRETILYGPPNARWGNPDIPCTYTGCTLGTGHIGPHQADGRPIPPPDTDPTPIHSDTLCTCRRPDRHREGCPRHESQIREPLLHRDLTYGWHADERA